MASPWLSGTPGRLPSRIYLFCRAPGAAVRPSGYRFGARRRRQARWQVEAFKEGAEHAAAAAPEPVAAARPLVTQLAAVRKNLDGEILGLAFPVCCPCSAP